jgi:hypothetical protein
MTLPLMLIPGVLCNNTLWQNCALLLQQDFSLHYADIPAQNNLTEMASQVENKFRNSRLMWILFFI